MRSDANNSRVGQGVPVGGRRGVGDAGLVKSRARTVLARGDQRIGGHIPGTADLHCKPAFQIAAIETPLRFDGDVQVGERRGVNAGESRVAARAAARPVGGVKNSSAGSAAKIGRVGGQGLGGGAINRTGLRVDAAITTRQQNLTPANGGERGAAVGRAEVLLIQDGSLRQGSTVDGDQAGDGEQFFNRLIAGAGLELIQVEKGL